MQRPTSRSWDRRLNLVGVVEIARTRQRAVSHHASQPVDLPRMQEILDAVLGFASRATAREQHTLALWAGELAHICLQAQAGEFAGRPSPPCSSLGGSEQASPQRAAVGADWAMPAASRSTGGGRDGEAVETVCLHDRPGAGSVEDQGQLAGELDEVVHAALDLVLEERGEPVLLPSGDHARRVFGRLELHRDRDRGSRENPGPVPGIPTIRKRAGSARVVAGCHRRPGAGRPGSPARWGVDSSPQTEDCRQSSIYHRLTVDTVALLNEVPMDSGRRLDAAGLHIARGDDRA